jgi:hypothetical protein
MLEAVKTAGWWGRRELRKSKCESFWNQLLRVRTMPSGGSRLGGLLNCSMAERKLKNFTDDFSAWKIFFRAVNHPSGNCKFITHSNRNPFSERNRSFHRELDEKKLIIKSRSRTDSGGRRTWLRLNEHSGAMRVG